MLQRHEFCVQVALDLPSIKATLSDKEYSLIASISGDNLGEQQRIPSGAVWLDQMCTAQQEQEAEEAGCAPLACKAMQTHCCPCLLVGMHAWTTRCPVLDSPG